MILMEALSKMRIGTANKVGRSQVVEHQESSTTSRPNGWHLLAQERFQKIQVDRDAPGVVIASRLSLYR